MTLFEQFLQGAKPGFGCDLAFGSSIFLSFLNVFVLVLIILDAEISGICRQSPVKTADIKTSK